MHDCVKPVEKLVKSLSRTLSLYTKYTGLVKYLTSQVFIVRSFCTTSTQQASGFKQCNSEGLNLLNSILYPLYTAPNINTNYIKE